jgi:hypothetical protein
MQLEVEGHVQEGGVLEFRLPNLQKLHPGKKKVRVLHA